MRSWWIAVLLSVAAGLAVPVQTTAGSAGEPPNASFTTGMELLRKADLAGALEAVGAAARADPQNPVYRQQYMLIQRVMKTRETIASETDPERWWRMAAGLQSFYYAHGLYREMVAIGRQMHEKRPSAVSATLLADAHLSLGQNAEAEQVLTGLEATAATLQAKALLGIALARQKKTPRAMAILGEIAVPSEPSPRFLFDLARLRVLCGDVEGGLATLARAFEATSARAQDGFRTLARTSGDFAPVATSEAFAKALATESKVAESSCSSGAGCGSCPSRKACPSAGGEPSGRK